VGLDDTETTNNVHPSQQTIVNDSKCQQHNTVVQESGQPPYATTDQVIDYCCNHTKSQQQLFFHIWPVTHATHSYYASM